MNIDRARNYEVLIEKIHGKERKYWMILLCLDEKTERFEILLQIYLTKWSWVGKLEYLQNVEHLILLLNHK